MVQVSATVLHTFQETPPITSVYTYTQNSAGFCNSFAHFSGNSTLLPYLHTYTIKLHILPLSIHTFPMVQEFASEIPHY